MTRNRVALLGVIVDSADAVEPLNQLLHDAREYILGRMGIPHRERGLNIISIVLDAPEDVVSALAGKVGMLPGVTAKAVYSKLPEDGK